MKRNMKVILCLAILMAFITTSLGLTTIAVKSIKVNNTNVRIMVGKTYKLKVTFTPEDATNKKVTFLSANRKVASVDKNGNIKGIIPGKTVITVTSTSNKKAVAKCNVTVTQGVRYTLPLTTKGETITIATQDVETDVSVASGLPVWKAIEKDTGVKVKWEVTPASGYRDSIKLRLASGSNLPDLLMLPDLDTSNLVNYTESKQIIALDELVDKYAPNMKKWFDQEDIFKYLASPKDGKLYFIPGTIVEKKGASNDSFNSVAPLIREDWLKTLGLNEPSTINDWYNTLKKFKEKDLAKNNKTIPFLSNNISSIRSMGWAYGLHLRMNSGIYPDSNGKVIYEKITPQYKEWLIEMNKWYKEGLIGSDSLTMDYGTWMSKFTSGVAGAADSTALGPGVFNPPLQNNTGDKNVRFIAVLPPVLKEGNKRMSEPRYGISFETNMTFAISKDCKNPELVIKWLDYQGYSKEGLIYNEFGIEGLSYKIVNGNYVWLDSLLNSKDGYTMEMFRLGGFHKYVPMVYTVYGRNYATNTAVMLPYKQKGNEIYKTTLETPKFPAIIPTVEENNKVRSVITDIDTYANEMELKFIRGNEPIERFENYVQSLKGLGIDDLIKVKQDQYDRYVNK